MPVVIVCEENKHDCIIFFVFLYHFIDSLSLSFRYPHIENDHLVKLLKQLISSTAPPSRGMCGGNAPNAADVPTLLGQRSFSLLTCR